ncbi:MAG: hypothetical protein ACI882_003172 [Reinekea sp.]
MNLLTAVSYQLQAFSERKKQNNACYNGATPLSFDLTGSYQLQAFSERKNPGRTY